MNDTYVEIGTRVSAISRGSFMVSAKSASPLNRK